MMISGDSLTTQFIWGQGTDIHITFSSFVWGLIQWTLRDMNLICGIIIFSLLL